MRDSATKHEPCASTTRAVKLGRRSDTSTGRFLSWMSGSHGVCGEPTRADRTSTAYDADHEWVCPEAAASELRRSLHSFWPGAVNAKGQLRPLDLVQTVMNRGLGAIADRIVNRWRLYERQFG